MKNIVPNENCLTEVQLLRYLHDECNAAEQKAIDRHLTHCPLCSDALEGAMMLNLPRLERTLKHIDTKIRTEYADKTPLKLEKEPNQEIVAPTTMTVVKGGKSRRWLWAAASVAIAATAGIFLLTKPVDTKDTNAPLTTVDTTTPSYATLPQATAPADVADAETMTKVGEPNSSKPPMPSNISANSELSSNKNTEGENPKDNDNNEFTDNKPTSLVSQDADRAVAVTKTPPTPHTEGVSADAKDVPQQMRSRQETEKVADIANADTYQKANATKNKQTRQQPTATTNSPYNNYPGAAAQNTNNEAAKPQAKAQTQPADSGLADYQIGMRFYQKGQYQEAVAQLNRVLAKQSQGEVYENALWYLANSYWKLDKKQDARVLLQKIVNEKGKYALQAATLLK